MKMNRLPLKDIVTYPKIPRKTGHWYLRSCLVSRKLIKDIEGGGRGSGGGGGGVEGGRGRGEGEKEEGEEEEKGEERRKERKKEKEEERRGRRRKKREKKGGKKEGETCSLASEPGSLHAAVVLNPPAPKLGAEPTTGRP